jgi:hypothetical protein
VVGECCFFRTAFAADEQEVGKLHGPVIDEGIAFEEFADQFDSSVWLPIHADPYSRRANCPRVMT